MEVDTVHSVRFAVLERAKFAVGRIAAWCLSSDNLTSKFFQVVFNLILLFDISQIQLVVMVFQRTVRDAFEWDPEWKGFCFILVRSRRVERFAIKISHDDLPRY